MLGLLTNGIMGDVTRVEYFSSFPYEAKLGKQWRKGGEKKENDISCPLTHFLPSSLSLSSKACAPSLQASSVNLTNKVLTWGEEHKEEEEEIFSARRILLIRLSKEEEEEEEASFLEGSHRRWGKELSPFIASREWREDTRERKLIIAAGCDIYKFLARTVEYL